MFFFKIFVEVGPKCFVRPTRDMMIKRGHRHVNMQGEIFMPYLHSWSYPRSNLVELVAMMSSLFGQFPPVFAVQKKYVE